MSPHEFVRRRAHVRSGVTKDEILKLHEFAGAPQGGAGVAEMRAKNERLGDWTGAKPLVETYALDKLFCL